jgi:PKD repeat protein
MPCFLEEADKIMKSPAKLILAVVLAMSLPGFLTATTYYVSGTAGNDSNPGTQSAPWRTIQKAANTMVAGDKVIVKGGTYSERISETTSGSSGNVIAYQVSSGETVTCQGFTISGSYVTVDGFKVDANNNNSTTGRGFYVSGDYVTVKNCYVTECPWGGIFYDQNASHGYIYNNRCYHNGQNGVEVWGSYHLIENNEVWESVQYHPQGGPSSGADADGMRFHGGHHTFRGNWIHEPALKSDPYNSSPHIDCFQTYDHASAGKPAASYCTFEKNHCRHYVSGMFTFMIEGSSANPAHHITIKNNLFEVGWGININAAGGSAGHDFYIYNNTFIGNASLTSSWPTAMDIRGASYVELKNNVTTNYKGNGNHRYIVSCTNLSVDYNCAYNTDGTNPSATPGSQSHELWAKDPKFVSPSNGNFHIQSSSPCVNAGASLSQVTDDFDGNSRPQGSSWDTGAFEYIAAGTPLNAGATGSPISGQAPLTVNFSGSASGGTSPYTYSWAFGDGGSSTSQNPSHTYQSASTYTATLTVKDNATATASKSVTITVTSPTSPLTANASASPTSGQVPLSVSFTGSASGGTSPYTYSWAFGDGGTSTSQNPSHTYSSSGTFSATLTVKDSASAAASKSVTITVTTAPAQLAAAASGSPTSGEAPLAVSFTGNATGGTAPYTYSWIFGDGGSSTSQNPAHVYASDGSYTATLTVTDINFANASATVSVTVTDSGTTADLSISAQTGSPAPGTGGTTDPAPGNHSYSIGSTVSVKSIAYTDYRFSKWTGDIEETSLFNATSSLKMDNDKSLSAAFCTKCADVNGDLKITPADAQLAFDIYLGRVASPTWCELENADVNSSGTKLAPKVTPADAQAIFHRYLKKGSTGGDCSGDSRTAAVSTQTAGFRNANLTIDSLAFTPELDILIPIIVESPSEVTAFGFDLAFPSNALTFIGLEWTELTKSFDLVDANVIPPPSINQVQASAGAEGTLVLRVGGYKANPGQGPSLGVLVILVFRGTGEFIDVDATSIIATYDDLQNASVTNRMISRQDDDSQIREDRARTQREHSRTRVTISKERE